VPPNVMHDAMATAEGSSKWQVMVVEDEEEFATEIKDLIERFEPVAGAGFTVTTIGTFAEARERLPISRPDILILDMFEGPPSPTGVSSGDQILGSLRQTTFIPVVIYTAIPERFAAHQSPFVHVQGKTGSPSELQPVVRSFLERRIPQLIRALRAQFDHTLRDYLWRFVEEHSATFSTMLSSPEFGRLVVDRLADSYSHEGVEEVLAAAYGDVPVAELNPESVHPSACYILPSADRHVRLGDLRKTSAPSGWDGHVMVLQPSCDLVDAAGGASRRARVPVTDVLCAAVRTLDSLRVGAEDIRRYRANNKSEHEHTLPPFMSIPEIVIDFKDLVLLRFAELKQMPLTARVASPFAERIAARFAAYIGRIGTPDIRYPPQ
jgi:CheY-like chemotaxis protein